MIQKTYDKEKAGIYLIRNLVTNKVYIGKTKCIYKRIKQHVTQLNTKSKDENPHLINAWHKYGRANFTYIVLEYLPLDEKLLAEKELFYMNLYDSLNPEKGYNLRYDSSTGMIVKEETKQKLKESRALRNIKFPNMNKETGIKSSLFWKNNPDVLKQMAEKVAEQIRIYKIGKFDYNTEELIEVYNTKRELKEKNPEYYIQAILGCCSGTKNSYKGYKWQYISIKTGEVIIKKYKYKSKKNQIMI